MQFLVSIICSWFLVCNGAPVVIHHVTPVKQNSFTLQSIGAISTKKAKTFIGFKPKSIKLGNGEVPQATTFAHIDANGNVDNVIVISQKEIDTGRWGNPSEWVPTDRGTHGAIIGGTHDNINGFLYPKPSKDAVLNAEKFWEVPASPGDPFFYTASST